MNILYKLQEQIIHIARIKADSIGIMYPTTKSFPNKLSVKYKMYAPCLHISIPLKLTVKTYETHLFCDHLLLKTCWKLSIISILNNFFYISFEE